MIIAFKPEYDLPTNIGTCLHCNRRYNLEKWRDINVANFINVTNALHSDQPGRQPPV